MKLLSLTNPWAVLMAIGAKHYETRSWSTTYRGPIAIQATKSFPEDCMELCREHPFVDVLVAAGITNLRALVDAMGKVVCVVDLIEVVRAVGTLPLPYSNAPACKPAPAGEHEESFGNYEAGRFVWMTTNLRRLAEPVPVVGVQGLRDLPADVEEKVRKQLL